MQIQGIHFVDFCLVSILFFGIASHGEDIVFIFIIKYSSLMDFGPHAIGVFLYKNF
jgi:hypothetical protein